MQDPKSLFYPLLAQIAVTFGVWMKLVVARLSVTYKEKIRPQALADEAFAKKAFKASENASDNFENLFELPVVFYVAVVVIYLTGSVNPLFLYEAWAFVFFRAVHSLIHCTTNKIRHRFLTYTLSSVILWVIWFQIAMRLITESRFE